MRTHTNEKGVATVYGDTAARRFHEQRRKDVIIDMLFNMYANGGFKSLEECLYNVAIHLSDQNIKLMEHIQMLNATSIKKVVPDASA